MSTTAAPRPAQHAKNRSGLCGTLSTPPTYKHVIWIFEENETVAQIIGSPAAPYINHLARECGLATNYYGITHFSLPNYVGATSGAPLGSLKEFYDDCNPPGAGCDSSAASIFGQSPSWKSYEESMPFNCDTHGTGFYVDRHNPAIYFTNLWNCSKNDVVLGTVGDSNLLNDFKSESTAPRFSFLTPNICDDMHGSSAAGCTTGLVQTGDRWLKTWIPLIARTPVYASGDTAIFITWDEGDGGPAQAGESCYLTLDLSCHIPMIVIAPSVKPGTRDGAMLSHYSLLKTTENLLGYPELGLARSAASFKSAFNL